MEQGFHHTTPQENKRSYIFFYIEIKYEKGIANQN